MKDMKNPPLISIIIPVYNVERYLDRCMKSVCNQTYYNLEIILVDDGSTDSSGVMCDKWAVRDSRIKVIHKENEGASSARNLGLDIASGEYIGFVDSDDWIDRTMYSYLLSLIETYSVKVAFCSFCRINRKYMKKWKFKEKIIVRENENLDNYFYRVNGEKSSYGVWCGIYDTRAIRHIRFIEGKITEDVMYTYEIYQAVRKIVFSSLPLYNYYINPQGVSESRLCQKDISLLEIWDEIVSREKGKFNGYNALLNRKRAVFTLYVKKILNGNKDVNEDIIKGWKIELKDSYKELSASNMFDWKRKLLLYFLTKF